jgi:hypothetical protein
MAVVDPFVADLDLTDALARTARQGAAFVREALTAAFLQRLQPELDRGPFRALPEEVGPVRQQAEAFELRGRPPDHPRLAELRGALGRAVREHGGGIRGLASWRPNEISVQRYRGAGVGITPHLDGKRYRHLVAVFTTLGTARFAICRDRAGEVLEEWETFPGSLVLLRGPGLAGVRDGRPFHRVSGPETGWRYSVGFRMGARSSP